MAEVALVQDGQDGELIIDCVAIFYEEGKGGENYRKKNKFRCRVSSTEKRLVKLKERIVCFFSSYRCGVWNRSDSPQAAQAHYLWVRASEVIWWEYTRIISVLSDAK